MGTRNQKKQTTATMHIRVKPSVKATAVRMAREDRRSLTRWLEWLIEVEAERVGGKK
jgi:predicted HicB family RNase H-like nuclease